MFTLDKLTKVVATYELPEIKTTEDSIYGSLRFVLQILTRPDNSYFPRILKKELAHVEPFYYEKSKPELLEKMTVELVILAAGFDFESENFPSEMTAIECVRIRMEEMFSK